MQHLGLMHMLTSPMTSNRKQRATGKDAVVGARKQRQKMSMCIRPPSKTMFTPNHHASAATDYFAENKIQTTLAAKGSHSRSHGNCCC